MNKTLHIITQSINTLILTLSLISFPISLLIALLLSCSVIGITLGYFLVKGHYKLIKETYEAIKWQKSDPLI